MAEFKSREKCRMKSWAFLLVFPPKLSSVHFLMSISKRGHRRPQCVTGYHCNLLGVDHSAHRLLQVTSAVGGTLHCVEWLKGNRHGCCDLLEQFPLDVCKPGWQNWVTESWALKPLAQYFLLWWNAQSLCQPSVPWAPPCLPHSGGLKFLNLWSKINIRSYYVFW